ncbi:MAG: hypothetical protein SVU69_10915 [Pseudomonadota bacterium]|nr:hypothetical protein [Pseudomonadota bacterium]
MSKYLFVFNLALAALCATMAVVLAVVAMMYLYYMGTTPRLADELPLVLQATGVFILGTGVYALGSWSIRRSHWLKWPSQILGVMAIILIALYAASLR